MCADPPWVQDVPTRHTNTNTNIIRIDVCRSPWVRDMLAGDPMEERLLAEVYEAGFAMYFEEKVCACLYVYTQYTHTHTHTHTHTIV